MQSFFVSKRTSPPCCAVGYNISRGICLPFVGGEESWLITAYNIPISLLLSPPALCFCKSSHLRKICRKVRISSLFSKVFIFTLRETVPEMVRNVSS